MATEKVKESEVVVGQFKRNLDSILLDVSAKGPELTVGDTVLRFKAKPPVKALALLVGSESQIDGMIGYIRTCLVKGQDKALEDLLDEIDVEGLGEILNALGEAYTSFPEKS